MKKILIILLFLSSYCLAADIAKQPIKYPGDCLTPSEKTEFCYRAQELLRLEHNIMGKKYKEGEITEIEWKEFLEDKFEPLSQKICEGININRELLKNSTKYFIDLEDFTEVSTP